MSLIFVICVIISQIYYIDAIVPTDLIATEHLSTTPFMEYGEAITINPLSFYDETFCQRPHPAYCTTKLSLDDFNRTVARTERLSPAIFTCPVVNITGNATNTGLLAWFRFNTSEYIGFYDFDTKLANTSFNNFGLFKIFNDSGLLVTEVTRKVVDRFVLCFDISLLL